MKQVTDPIGVFDSGVGGITVLQELQKLMPNEDYIYLGDTARVPYGNKSEDLIISYTKDCVNFLLEKRVKLIVIACNTASSFGYLSAKDFAKDIEIVEMIRPAAAEALRISKTKAIGVLGTKGTISNGAYQRELERIAKESNYYLNRIISIPCPLFVPFIEEGKCDHPSLNTIAEEYLVPIKSHKLTDTLILGCTHYPIIKNILQNILGDQVKLLNTGQPAAKEAQYLLSRDHLLNMNTVKGNTKFFVTDSPSLFSNIALDNLNYPIDKIEKVVL